MRETRSAQLNRIGNEHFSRGFYTDAFNCYTLALETDRQSGDPRALVATLGNLGNICAVSGRRDQAQTFYQEVLELQKTLGDHRGISTTLGNLGNLHVDAGEWERGRAYYLEALDMMQVCGGDDGAKAVLLSDLGLVAKETRHFPEAQSYYEQSLVLMKRVGNTAGQTDVFRMLARLFLAWEKPEDALACLQTSLAIAQRLGDELRIGGAWYVLAGYYEEIGNLEQAVTHLERVIRVDRKYGLPKLEENIQRMNALRDRLLDQTLAETSPPEMQANG